MENQKIKINYSLILEDTIKKAEREGKRPTLLLHACCAPCSSYVLEYLSKSFDITLLFYNPNISPEEAADTIRHEFNLYIQDPEKYPHAKKLFMD